MFSDTKKRELIKNGEYIENNDVPDSGTLYSWLIDGTAEATDGCCVEPDGECEHGCPSWLLELNLI